MTRIRIFIDFECTKFPNHDSNTVLITKILHFFDNAVTNGSQTEEPFTINVNISKMKTDLQLWIFHKKGPKLATHTSLGDPYLIGTNRFYLREFCIIIAFIRVALHTILPYEYQRGCVSVNPVFLNNFLILERNFRNN